MIDIRQTPEYAKYLSLLGWKVESIEGTYYFVKKLPLIGSVIKIQRPKKIDFEVIEKTSKKYRAFQIILEPNLLAIPSRFVRIHNQILSHGFKLSKSPYLPTKSLHLDLTKPLKFEKETRRSIRVGEKTIIKEYSSSNEIKIFREAWKKSVNFNRYVPSVEQLINLRKSFPQNKSLFLTSHNIFGSIIGGAIFTQASHDRSNYITYYWQGFTNSEGRTSLSQYALLYHGILWGKKQGCKLFDFEGIYDKRFPNESWLGFSHFKKSFGGSEILYPGTFVKYRFPFSF